MSELVEQMRSYAKHDPIPRLSVTNEWAEKVAILEAKLESAERRCEELEADNQAWNIEAGKRIADLESQLAQQVKPDLDDDYCGHATPRLPEEIELDAEATKEFLTFEAKCNARNRGAKLDLATAVREMIDRLYDMKSVGDLYRQFDKETDKVKIMLAEILDQPQASHAGGEFQKAKPVAAIVRVRTLRSMIEQWHAFESRGDAEDFYRGRPRHDDLMHAEIQEWHYHPASQTGG